MNETISLKEYVDTKLSDAEKRHDERYINQKDYNTYHNNLQREMKEQAEKYPTRESFDALRDRMARLERWPWAMAGVFAILIAIVGATGTVIMVLYRIR